jgi:hypothetical protein
MTNAVTPGANQPKVKVIFNPEPYVLTGAKSQSGAFKIVVEGTEGVQAAEAGEPQVKIFLVDSSESTNRNNIRQDCVSGLEVALDKAIGPNDLFCIIEFADNAYSVFPREDERLFASLRRDKPPAAVPGTPENIARAKAAIQKLRQNSSSSTNMSAGLRKVLKVFIDLECEEALCIMMSDGMNNPDDQKKLSRVLAQIAQIRQTTGNMLKVQTIAVGPDPSRHELNQISQACLGEGNYHIQRNTGADVWAETFTKILEDATRRVVSAVTIKFEQVRSSRLIDFKQTNPMVRDMTEEAKAAFRSDGDAEGGQGEYSIPTGAWSVNTGLYAYTFAVEKPPHSDDLLIGRLRITYKWGRKLIALEPQSIMAYWTNNKTLTERMSREEEEARGIQGSVAAFKLGLEAMDRKDETAALIHFQKAVDLTISVGDTAYLQNLQECLTMDATHKVIGVGTLRDNSARIKADFETERRPAIAQAGSATAANSGT